MSQNYHTLLLFFKNETHYKSCLHVLNNLKSGRQAGDEGVVEEWVEMFSPLWNNDWFNASVVPTPKYICLSYETSTRYGLPLKLLKQLFEVELRAACLEVFYDQVGEYEHFYFFDNKIVDKDEMFKRFKLIPELVREQFQVDPYQQADNGYDKPEKIKRLIADEEKALKDVRESVDGLMEIMKSSNETGVNPVRMMRSALVLRAAGKGFLHAVGFGVFTVLLFKGVWLWTILTLILIVLLPVIYINKVTKDLDEDVEIDVQMEGDTC